VVRAPAVVAAACPSRSHLSVDFGEDELRIPTTAVWTVVRPAVDSSEAEKAENHGVG
jgi:hypothetical protein